MLMTNWFSYILVALISLQSFGVNPSNSVSIVILVDHYEHHKDIYNTSFLEFLDLHYGGQKEAHQDEHQEHEHLPFQENQIFTHTFFFETPETLQLKPRAVMNIVHHNFRYSSNFGLLRITKILHPPKHSILI